MGMVIFVILLLPLALGILGIDEILKRRRNNESWRPWHWVLIVVAILWVAFLVVMGMVLPS
jgi:hypothetical protein